MVRLGGAEGIPYVGNPELLPAGFGLDKFGMIVHEQFVVPRPTSASNTGLPAESDLRTKPSDNASDAAPLNPPGSDRTEPSEPPSEPPETNFSTNPPEGRSVH
jgi:hypothetical protein